MTATENFSLSQFTTGDHSFADDLALVRQLGIPAMELCEAKLDRDDERAAAQLAQVRDAGVALSSVQARVHSVFPDQMAPEPPEPEARLEAFGATLDRFAAAFPGESLPFVLIGGRAPEHDFGRAWGVAVQFAQQAADAAAQRGQKVAFEVLHPVLMNEDTFLCGWDQALALVEAVGRPNFGLVCDLWHVWQERDIVARVHDSLDRVMLVHVSDWRAGGPRALNDRVPPGEGIIPLPEWGRVLGTGGYRGWVGLEMLSDRRLADSYLRRPLAEVVRDARSVLRGAGFLQACQEAAR